MMIAMSLLLSPEILIADEPTGNLDSLSANNIFAILKNLSKAHNIACLVVTHNLDLASNADRIIKISCKKERRRKKNRWKFHYLFIFIKNFKS